MRRINNAGKDPLRELGRVIDFDLRGFYRSISKHHDLSFRGCRDFSAEIPQKLERDAERREDFTSGWPLRAASHLAEVQRTRSNKSSTKRRPLARIGP